MALRRLERREANYSTPLQIYLHDINDTPLLSAAGGASACRARGGG